MGVRVRERPAGSGKWWIYTNFRGKRTARYVAQGKRAADRMAAEIATKLELIKQTEKHGLTASAREVITGKMDSRPSQSTHLEEPLFEDYATQWLEVCRVRGLKGSTRRAYSTIMEVHLVPAFGHLYLSQIDRKAVKAFVYQKLQEPIPLSRKDATKTKPRSARTVLHCLCVLSAVFNAAIDDFLSAVVA